MEELIQEDNSFGLNIICDPTQASNANPEKKKKTTFKERKNAKKAKRAAAKAAKFAKLKERHEQRKSLKKNNSNNLATSIPNSMGDRNGDDDNSQSGEENDSTLGEKTQQQAEHEDETSRKLSRRNHKNILGKEEERAKYMAEFHAHPMEMDRRNKAVSTIKTSSKSSHIFEEENKDQEELNSSNNDSKEGKSCPFKSLGLSERLSSALTSERGPFQLVRPTIIQSRTINALVKNRDGLENKSNLFIQSETGSGKTLAYLLPIYQYLIDKFNDDGKNTNRSAQNISTFIILPTRELTTQTFQTALQLSQKSYSKLIIPVCLSGGEKRKSEKARLRKGVSLVIATPGRLLDHLQKTECLRNSLTSSSGGGLSWLVLDEADRLLDMGLGSQVKSIVEVIKSLSPSKANSFRSILVSATVAKEIQALAKDVLCYHKNSDSATKRENSWKWVTANKIEVKEDLSSLKKNGENKEESSSSESLPFANSAPSQLAQQYMIVSAKLRLPALISFLVARVKKNERTVVFMSTCQSVDFYHNLFTSVDYCVLDNDRDINDENKETTSNDSKGLFGNSCSLYRLHGNVPHSERHTILQKFTRNSHNKKDKAREVDRTASILFATDVAARGLNLPGVDWIVQYDPPCETSDYIHRAGRTARAGNAGNALLFLLPSEKQYIDILQLKGLTDISSRNSALSLATTLQLASKYCPNLTKEGEKKSGGSNSNRKGEAFAMALQEKLEQYIIQDAATRKEAAKRSVGKGNKRKKDGKQSSMAAIKEQQKLLMEDSIQESARKAFTSFLRAYPAKEKAVRHIFCARALHLGHIARSFALKDPPKAISRSIPIPDSDENGKNNEEKKNGLKFKKAPPKNKKQEVMDIMNKKRKIENLEFM